MSTEQFIRNLIDSGITPADEVETFVAALNPKPAGAEALARELVKQKKLTSYQAKTIWQGKQTSLVFGNYVVLDKLGEGGMGMVFKAEHRRMERLVALKVLSPKVTKDPTALLRFHREVKAAAKLSHPNIVAAHDADEAKGVHFLVMEFVDGIDLSALVKQRGPLSVARAVDFILQAARGLEHAHAQGIIHRDIKPSNLLADQSGTIKILDMGLARMDESVGSTTQQSELTTTGTIMGTVDYMSPEQALDTKQADQRSDIYSLGCSLFYLLTGKPVFGGNTAMKKLLAHREQPIPLLCAVCEAAPPSLDSVFQRMLAKDPAQRFQTMAEVVQEMAACLRDAPSGTASSQTLVSTASDESAFRNFLDGLDTQPGGTRTQARSDVKVAEGETQVSQADDATDTSSLRTAAQKLRLAKSNTRNSAIIIGGVLGTLLLGILIWNLVVDHGVSNDGGAGNSQETTLQNSSSNSTHKSKTNLESDRAIAEWILEIGGTIEIDGNAVKTKIGLPMGATPITSIGFPHAVTKSLLDTDLHRIAGQKNVTKLTVSGVSSKSFDWTPLASLTSLQVAQLEYNELDDDGVKHLSGLANLRDIQLRQTSITDVALMHLPSSISRLGLLKTDITDRGLERIAAFRDLTSLNIQTTQITDEGLAHLRALENLQELYFGNTAVSDRGLADLTPLVGLKQLSLIKTSVTAEGVAKLQQALSGCEIRSDFTEEEINQHLSAVTGSSKNVQVTIKLRRTLHGHAAKVVVLRFSPPDGIRLAAADASNVIKLWNLQEPSEPLNIQMKTRTFEFSPDGKMFAVVDEDVTLFQIPGGQFKARYASNADVAWSQGGQLIAGGSYNETFNVWQLDSNTPKWTLLHYRAYELVFVPPDGRLLATGSGEETKDPTDPVGRIKFWDMSTGELSGTLDTGRMFTAMTIAPDGSLLATAAISGAPIELYDLRTMKSTGDITPIDDRAEHVAFSPDSKVLIDWDPYRKKVGFSDPRSREHIVALDHQSNINAVAISPDGRTLATACQDNKIRLFDIEIK